MARSRPLPAALAWLLLPLLATPAAGADHLVVREGRVRAVAFSPDGKWLASASGGRVVVTNVATRKVDFVLEHPGREGSEGSVWSVAFSPDGKVLAAGYTAWVEVEKLGAVPVGAVKLWATATGREVETLVVKGETLTNPLFALAFSPGGKYLAAGGARSRTKPTARREADKLPAGVPEGELKVWARDKLQLRAAVPAPLSPVHALDFSPDGNTVAFASGDTSYALDDGDRVAPMGEVSFWDVTRNREDGKVTWRREAAAAVAFSPRGGLVAVGGGVVARGPLEPRAPAGRLVLWDAANKKQAAELVGHRFLVAAVAFSPDGKLVAAGGGDYAKDAAELRLWDVTEGKEVADLSAGLRPVVGAVRFSPDGRHLAAASDKTVTLWEVAAVLREGKRR